MSLSDQKSKSKKEITKSIIKSKKVQEKLKIKGKNQKDQLSYYLNMVENISTENYQKYVLKLIRNNNHNQPQITTNQKLDLESQNVIKSPNEIICPICLDYIVSASTTVCGHTYCEQCIEESLLKFLGCPICRSPLRQYHQTYCKTLDFYIQKFIESLESSEKNHFIQRIQNHQTWKKSMKLENYKVGLIIDVRDTEFIWCQGIIQKIEYQRNNKAIFLVHYEGWNKIFDEYLPEDSSRIAPLGVFTNRVDIPKYKLHNNHHIHPNNQYTTFNNNLSNSQNQFIGLLLQQLSSPPTNTSNANSNNNSNNQYPQEVPQEVPEAQINVNDNQNLENNGEIAFPLQSMQRNISNRLTVRFRGWIQEFYNQN